MVHKTILLVSLILIVLSFSRRVTAQSEQLFTCPEIVDQALETADMVCANTGRNQVCYGNSLLSATSRADVTTFKFDSAGDIELVAAVESLRINALDEPLGIWGVALMRLQASLPNTLPGQNVTFVLFGDVQINNKVTDEQIAAGDYTPMQAFYLSTGIGMSRCEEAPPDGVLVQTPEGVGEVSFIVNEVEIAIGSTAFLKAEPQGDMLVTMLEGAAAVRVNQEVFPIVEGTRLRFPIDAQLRPLADHQPILESYARDELLHLPVELLERSIDIRDGFDDDELALAQSRIQLNQPLCGEAPFLPCTRLPVVVGGELCVLADSRESSLTRFDDAERPICQIEVINPDNDLGILPTPTPIITRVEPTSTPLLRIAPTATLVPRSIDPTAVSVPRIEPTVTSISRIDPTATPELKIAQTATPISRTEPTATPVPRTEPTATPAPRSDSTSSLSSLLDPLGLTTNLLDPDPTATPKIDPTATLKPA